MSVWAQILLQESISPTIQFLSLFHDYALAIISIILLFVRVISICIITNSITSSSSIITFVEVVWTVIPIIILILLAIPSLQILYYIEENDPFLTIKVTGNQWYWNYEVIDIDLEFDSYIINDSPWAGEYRLLEVDHRLVVPTHKDLRVLVTAADVLHCWALPRLGVKIDAVPGRLNQLSFNSIRPSLSYGQCSEICGTNHSFIPIVLERISIKRFLTWIRITS